MFIGNSTSHKLCSSASPHKPLPTYPPSSKLLLIVTILVLVVCLIFLLLSLLLDRRPSASLLSLRRSLPPSVRTDESLSSFSRLTHENVLLFYRTSLINYNIILNTILHALLFSLFLDGIISSLLIGIISPLVTAPMLMVFKLYCCLICEN